MIYQLHWQESRPPHPPHANEFVAQSDDVVDQAGMDLAYERFRKLIEERRTECPAGWRPMICDEGAKEFVRVAEETT